MFNFFFFAEKSYGTDANSGSAIPKDPHKKEEAGVGSDRMG